MLLYFLCQILSWLTFFCVEGDAWSHCKCFCIYLWVWLAVCDIKTRKMNTFINLLLFLCKISSLTWCASTREISYSWLVKLMYQYHRLQTHKSLVSYFIFVLVSHHSAQEIRNERVILLFASAINQKYYLNFFRDKTVQSLFCGGKSRRKNARVMF